MPVHSLLTVYKPNNVDFQMKQKTLDLFPAKINGHCSFVIRRIIALDLLTLFISRINDLYTVHSKVRKFLKYGLFSQSLLYILCGPDHSGLLGYGTFENPDVLPVPQMVRFRK